MQHRNVLELKAYDVPRQAMVTACLFTINMRPHALLAHYCGRPCLTRLPAMPGPAVPTFLQILVDNNGQQVQHQASACTAWQHPPGQPQWSAGRT